MPLTDEEIAAKAPRAHLDAAVYEIGKLGPYTSGQYLKWTEDSLRTPHANVENFVSLSEDKERVTIHKSGVYRITVRLEVGTDDDPREFILKPLATAETAKYATDANRFVNIESFYDEGVNAVQESEIFNIDPGTELCLQYKSPEEFVAPSGISSEGRFSNDLQICRLSNYLMTAVPQWDQPSELWKERNARYDSEGKIVPGGPADVGGAAAVDDVDQE